MNNHPEILARSSRSAPSRRPGSAVLFRGRAVEILGTGTDSLLIAEDDQGICIMIGGCCPAARPADLLHGSERSQLAVVAELKGHFAAVLVDKRSETIRVLRDLGGFQHVYYATGRRLPIMSTDLGWLIAEGGLGAGDKSVERRALGLYVSFQYIPAPYTPYRGVRQLGPGEILEIAPGRLSVVREGPALLEETPAYAPGDMDSHARQVKQHLQRSLARVVQNSKRPGAFLSGGMDTSANIAILVDELGIKPIALTASFREPRYDESRYARIVARHYGLDHIEVQIVPDMLDRLAAIVRHFPSPHGDRAAFAQYFLAEAARKAGCEQVCTGEGGDEVMGYPRSRDENEAYRHLPERDWELASWYLEKTCLAPVHWRQRLLGSLQLEPEFPIAYLANVQRRFKAFSPFERLYFGQWQTWLIDGVYMKDHGTLGAHGMRPALPFMDSSLMRYMGRVEPEIKMSGLEHKRLIKIALQDSLPPEILKRAKHKFWVPFAEWFRGPSRGYLEDILAARQGFVCTEFGNEAVHELIAEHMAGFDHSRLLWALLFLELWHIEHIQAC